MKLNLFLCLTLSAAFAAHAQIGDSSDKPGEVQKVIVPPELIPPSPVLSVEQAKKAFKLAPGIKIECVASEPLVEDPVEAAFDPDGNLFVVEMRGYMPDLDGHGEDQAVGQIAMLRDTDGDGIFDKKTVFVDKLVMPRAVTPVAGGVLVGAPPHLWFCRDTNGDGVADEKIEIASDYGVAVDPKRPELANPERAPNHLTWNLDNWIYSAAYMSKFRYVNGEWKKGLTIFRGQYGLSQDNDGHLFYNSNSDQLRTDVIPGHYVSRNPTYQHPNGINVNAAENQFVWPARVNPGINRGYRAEMLRDYKLKEFTAACSPYVFYSDLFPKDFYGNAIVCEPAGNLVHRDVLVETNGTITSHNPYDKAEFIASTDEWFRPVNSFSGPDGALYIVDFHRGNIEHRISLTTYLRKQDESRGLQKPIHLGRIWRIVPEGKTAPKPTILAKDTPAQLVDRLSSPNSWIAYTAQRLLVEKHDSSVVPALKNAALHASAPTGRVHALWTLHGLDAIDLPTVTAAFHDKDAKVRANAIRVSEKFFDSEDKSDVVDKLLKMTDDTDASVQLQLALTLGEVKEKNADQALVNLAKSSTPNMFLADAILSGLGGRETQVLADIMNDPEWSKPGTNAQKVIRGLATCITTSRNSENVAKLLEVAATAKTTNQRLLLEGMITASPKKPVKFKAEPAALASLEKVSTATDATKRIAKVSSFLTWPNKPGAKPEPVLAPLSTEEQARFDSGKRLFQGSCAACHQLHGLGMDGLAPPLVDSEWVLGSEQRLVRIVLHGLTGPLRVNGRSYHLDMPSMGMFDDDQLASILTYVRREWENTGSPIDPATVKKIRLETAKRQEAWSQPELLKVP